MSLSRNTRRLLGQHFTPEPLVRLVCSLGIRHASDRVLDPACGDGAFLRGAVERLASLGASAHDGQIAGFEIDPAHAATAAGIRGVHVTAADFFSQNPSPCFDSIVGNFPFVRQEFLVEQRNRIAGIVCGEWAFEFPAVLRLSGRADLYLYFFLHALRFLREGGRMAVISGNSWLHAPYGGVLRELFLEKLRLEMVLESRSDVWFAHTTANAVITVLQKTSPSQSVAFVQLPALSAACPATDDPLPRGSQVRQVPAAALRAEQNWSCRLRAPGVYFSILELAGERLTEMSNAARIARGITTGLNRFFIIEREKAAAFGIEQEFLRPVVASLKNVKSLVLRPEHAGHCLVCVNRPRERLRGTRVLAYIEEFERSGALPAHSPSLAGRGDWFCLALKPPADLVILRFRRERHFSPANPHGLLVSDTVFTAAMRNRSDVPLCIAAANGTLFHFFAEVAGRDNMGGGFITTYGPEIRTLLLPAMDCIRPHENELTTAFGALAARDIDTMQKELRRADRRSLDEIIWKALRLPGPLLDEMYSAFDGILERRKHHGQMARSRLAGKPPT
ncbi:MAG TPA: N-6 DNA methylase [Planctomycetota bacterium]|nr:N-6 DNA methylase [Planctomycetota bacterium]